VEVLLVQELRGAAEQFVDLFCRRQHPSPMPAEACGKAAIL
jgi:hypothetical protein